MGTGGAREVPDFIWKQNKLKVETYQSRDCGGMRLQGALLYGDYTYRFYVHLADPPSRTDWPAGSSVLTGQCTLQIKPLTLPWIVPSRLQQTTVLFKDPTHSQRLRHSLAYPRHLTPRSSESRTIWPWQWLTHLAPIMKGCSFQPYGGLNPNPDPRHSPLRSSIVHLYLAIDEWL